MPQKQDGFKGQMAIVLPKHIQAELQTNHLTKLLFATDIGYYPRARFHFRERPEGSSQYILIHCVDGSGWVRLEKLRRKITKGQFFIIPAGFSHAYGADISNPWSIYWMHFSGESSFAFADAGFAVRLSESAESTRYNDRIRLFEEIYHTLSHGYSLENLEYASICIWHYLGSFFYLQQFERSIDTNLHAPVEKVIRYMQNRLTDHVSLNDMAVYAGFSVSHFSLLFRKKTTRSPVEYFLGLKMQRACQMLDFTDMNIKEIASGLAFNDPFYFSRLFRKMIGISPAEYRKNKKG